MNAYDNPHDTPALHVVGGAYVADGNTEDSDSGPPLR